MVTRTTRDPDACVGLPRYRAIRAATVAACAPLTIEDHVVQSMPDCSPARWHLAHTTWFFETFVLRAFEPSFRAFHPIYDRLFNSYYQTLGVPLPRDRRGTLSRPTVAEVMAYRAAVDERMATLQESSRADDARLRELVELGLHHEQQHQELILTDIKHAFAQNPLLPCYAPGALATSGSASTLGWHEHAGGIVEIGHAGRGFAFDNEGPRHRTLLRPFALASRLVTNGEFAEFVADGGYRRAELWLAEGWQYVQDARITAPLYVDSAAGTMFTLRGDQPIDAHAPVCHVSYFEADAFARWSGARLPLESEWEVVAAALPIDGNFVESGRLHPAGAPPSDALRRTDGKMQISQMFGDAWEWTSSPYAPYPGYAAAPGAVGEYNGKFMINQMVLRGGSCVTPRDHVRATYRNFFAAGVRWQFCGIRLARDLASEAPT